MVETTKPLTTKLKQAIGILSKLKNNIYLKTPKMTYHYLFSSHLLYGSQLWRHTNLTEAEANTEATEQTLEKNFV